jgi:hypothetical protein
MDFDYSLKLDEHRNILLTEISKRTFEEQALDDLDSDYGFFVVVEDTLAGTFDVLAKAASISAGQALMRMLIRSGAKPHLVTA